MCTRISLLRFGSICVPSWIIVWWRGMNSHLNILKIRHQKQVSLLNTPEKPGGKDFSVYIKVQVQNTNAGQGAFSYKIMNLPGNSLTERLSWCWSGAGTSVTTIHSACLLEVHNLLESDGWHPNKQDMICQILISAMEKTLGTEDREFAG